MEGPVDYHFLFVGVFFSVLFEQSNGFNIIVTTISFELTDTY